MHVCIFMYKYMYIYLFFLYIFYVHIQIHVYIYICIHIHVYVYIYIYMYMYMYACLCTVFLILVVRYCHVSTWWWYNPTFFWQKGPFLKDNGCLSTRPISVRKWRKSPCVFKQVWQYIIMLHEFELPSTAIDHRKCNTLS